VSGYQHLNEKVGQKVMIRQIKLQILSVSKIISFFFLNDFGQQ
jgi:hypothetical protein